MHHYRFLEEFRMKKKVNIPVLLAFALLTVFSVPVLSQDFADLTSPDEIQKFRQDFIDAFSRSGLNTTPGDARMLRILIAAAGCQRGIEVGTATGFGAINMGMALS